MPLKMLEPVWRLNIAKQLSQKEENSCFFHLEVYTHLFFFLFLLCLCLGRTHPFHLWLLSPNHSSRLVIDKCFYFLITRALFLQMISLAMSSLPSPTRLLPLFLNLFGQLFCFCLYLVVIYYPHILQFIGNFIECQGSWFSATIMLKK